MPEDPSYTRAIWLRLKKNRAAFASLVCIAIFFLAAVFCYMIAPDSSPNADRQTVEIQAKKSGYTQLFLTIPDKKNEASSLMSRLFFGKADDLKYIPITNYTIDHDLLTVSRYVDEDTTIAQQYSIAQLTNGHPDKIDQYIISKKYWLGTDAFGRDILSRLLVGTRVSLSVGIIAVLISLTLGVCLGAIAGYFQGWADRVIMWLINITWSIPTLLLVFAVTMAMGKGFFQIFIAIGLTMWVNVARLVRGQVLGIKELEYVHAARTMGFSNGRIIIRHILPNITGPLIVLAAGNFATAIIIEAGLSFLGIGVQPPQPSWGLMIKENYSFILTHNPMLALIPGFAIMLVVLAFNLLGNGLRDATDVKN